MISIYDQIIENEFKTDSEGRTVYFAKGLTKPGYILPDEEKKTEIKKIISRYSSIFMTLFLGSFFLHNFFISLIIFPLIHFGWYRRKIYKAIEGLQVSDLKPKLDPVNLVIGVGLIGIVAIVVLLSGIMIPIIVRSGGLKGIIISISSFFVILIAAIIAIYYFIIIKDEKKLLKKPNQSLERDRS